MNLIGIKIHYAEIALICSCVLLSVGLSISGYIMISLSILSMFGRFIMESQSREDEKKRKQEELASIQKLVFEAAAQKDVALFDTTTH